MRVYRPEDFKKMARAIVDRSFDASTPLNDEIVKSALDNELNPDQIKNLVQLANTMAHLTLFDQKDGDDKMVEFDPADPAVVLKKVYQDDEPPATAAVSSDAPERVTDMFGNLTELVDKVKGMLGQDAAAPVEEVAEEVAEPEALSPKKKQMIIIKIRKVASHLNDRKLQSAYEYKEELDKLAAEFAKLYGPSFEDFEKDAVSLRGGMSVPVLQDLRRCLRLPTKVDTSHAKLARVVDSDTPEMKSFHTLMKLAEEYSSCSAACEYMQEKFGGAL
jgi:hypothetical protein